MDPQWMTVEAGFALAVPPDDHRPTASLPAEAAAPGLIRRCPQDVTMTTQRETIGCAAGEFSPKPASTVAPHLRWPPDPATA
jgi:hypothetical protein